MGCPEASGVVRCGVGSSLSTGCARTDPATHPNKRRVHRDGVVFAHPPLRVRYASGMRLRKTYGVHALMFLFAWSF